MSAANRAAVDPLEVRGTDTWQAERILREIKGFSLNIASTRRFLLRRDGVEVVTKVTEIDKFKIPAGKAAYRLPGDAWRVVAVELIDSRVPAKCGPDNVEAVRRLSVGRWM